MKTEIKKLQLSKETVRELVGDDLSRAAGGWPTNGTMCLKIPTYRNCIFNAAVSHVDQQTRKAPPTAYWIVPCQMKGTKELSILMSCWACW